MHKQPSRFTLHQAAFLGVLLTVWLLAAWWAERRPAQAAGPLFFSTFESGSFASEGWTVVNGAQVNKWEVGSAVNNGGTRAAYISNDGGTTTNYSAVATVAHFYRDVTFPAGESRIILSFDWRGQGSGTFGCDLRVFLVPTSTTPVAGTQLSSGQIGATLLSQSVFTNTTLLLDAAHAGTTQRLVFSWRNFSGSTFSPGFAVDNILLVTQPPPSLSGTVNVGANEVYPSLTNSGGLFHALNDGNLSGNLTVNITSDLTNETGLHALNQVVEVGGGGYTITIKPSGGARLISGSKNTALLRLNGTDRITFDGSLTPGSRDLTIRNTHTLGTVVRLQNSGTSGAQNNAFKYLNLEGGALTATNVIGFSGADNDNNRIEGCNLSRAQIGIFSEGESAANPNQGNVFTKNLLNTPAPNNLGFAGITLGYEDNAQVTENVISAVSSGSHAYGIDAGHFSAKAVTNITIARNLISDITAGANSIFRHLGIGLVEGATGTSQISNNAVSLQPKDSALYTTAVFISAATGSTTQIYFNSISFNGNGNVTDDIIFALTIAGNDPVVDLRNNVLSVTNTINNANGAQAALGLLYQTSNIFNNLTSDYNDFFLAPGIERYAVINTDFFSFSNGFATLANWQTASGEDAHSLMSNPLFNEPNTNLRPLTGSPLLGAGMTGTGVTTDILGMTRGNPPSIGAYETASDTTPPAISYTMLANSSLTTTRDLNNVTITDLTGVNTTAGTKPRLYYKRSTDANTFNDNTSATDGWKFVEASNSTSPFNFTIDYTKLNGGSVSPVTTIQYFVVAQDTAVPPNVGINTGTFATPPASVNLAAAHFPIGGTLNSFQVVTAIPTTVNVGTGQTFTSLTNNGGLFEAINNRVLTGNSTVNITSDLTAETGTHALNQWAEDGVGNYLLTIQPSGGARLVSGSSNFSALIRLNGADRVTIDGSGPGGARDLTFRVTEDDDRAVIWLQSNGTNGAQQNTFRKLNLEGFGQSTLFGIGSGDNSVTQSNGVDNDQTRIEGCQFGKLKYGIFLVGESVSNKNTGTVVADNLLNLPAPNQIYLGGIFVDYDGANHRQSHQCAQHCIHQSRHLWFWHLARGVHLGQHHGIWWAGEQCAGGAKLHRAGQTIQQPSQRYYYQHQPAWHTPCHQQFYYGCD
jgi:hypothetical protein